MKTMFRLICFLTLAMLTGAGASAAFAQEDSLPAVERCQQFCGRIYGEGSDEHHECAQACTEADACHQRCKQKFGEEAPKVHGCFRRCMSRHDEPPAEIPVSDNPAVEL